VVSNDGQIIDDVRRRVLLGERGLLDRIAERIPHCVQDIHPSTDADA